MRIVIENMPDGGYVVGEWCPDYTPTNRMFACTELKDALEYIGKQFRENKNADH